MKLIVTLYAQYREIARAKDVELEIEGWTVKDVIESLILRYPDLSPLLFTGGQLRQYVNVTVNGKPVRDTGGLSTPVADGDQLRLFPPVAGG
jgi:molybdopterin synthase sulfur carrier subunit